LGTGENILYELYLDQWHFIILLGYG